MPDFLKDYEPVEDRLRAFWEDHPLGRVNTELVQVNEETGGFIFKASIWRHPIEVQVRDEPPTHIGEPPDATGYAADSVTALPPNMKASALEVAETSAIGRALANLGYAAKGKRPSREEMSKASAPSPTGQKTSVGEAGGADTGPGEGSRTSSGPTTCDHRYPSGAPAKVIKGGREICKLCGVPWVTAVEGTTEDLGGP